MLPDTPALPFTVNRRDPSGLLAVTATVVGWREDPRGANVPPAVTLTLGAGTLHDADKGAFPLDGLELTVRVANGRVEPIRVRNPGPLSEFQQEGVLDAVSSALNARVPNQFRIPQE